MHLFVFAFALESECMVFHGVAHKRVPRSGIVVEVLAHNIPTDEISDFNLFRIQLNTENAESSVTRRRNLEV